MLKKVLMVLLVLLTITFITTKDLICQSDSVYEKTYIDTTTKRDSLPEKNDTMVVAPDTVNVTQSDSVLTSDTTYSDYQEGIASWYGDPNHKMDPYDGRKTASGIRFNTREMWAAHKTLSFGDVVKVTNLVNGKYVYVTIVDRGPFKKGRIIDLSNAAKNVIDMDGLATVKIERIYVNGDLLTNKDIFEKDK